MTPEQRKRECGAVRKLLPTWDGGRWTVEIRGGSFAIRRFGAPTREDRKLARYYFQLPGETWAQLKGMNDGIAKRTLAATCERKRDEWLAADADERRAIAG